MVGITTMTRYALVPPHISILVLLMEGTFETLQAIAIGRDIPIILKVVKTNFVTHILCEQDISAARTTSTSDGKFLQR